MCESLGLSPLEHPVTMEDVAWSVWAEIWHLYSQEVTSTCLCSAWVSLESSSGVQPSPQPRGHSCRKQKCLSHTTVPMGTCGLSVHSSRFSGCRGYLGLPHEGHAPWGFSLWGSFLVGVLPYKILLLGGTVGHAWDTLHCCAELNLVFRGGDALSVDLSL